MTTISNARKLNKGALRGFFDVELPSGMKLNGCTLLEKDGKPLPTHVRVTIGTAAEMEKFKTAFERVVRA